MNSLFSYRRSSVAVASLFTALAVVILLDAPEANAEHHVLGRLAPYQNCRVCHGDDLQGGIGRSCFGCHDRLWPGGDTPPLADAGGPYSGEAGKQVSFDGSRSLDVDGSVVSYLWDFGDGSVGTEMQSGHTYASAGTYTVTLTVTDDSGHSDTAIADVRISGSSFNVPPLADAAGPYSGAVGVPVLFDGSGSIDVDGTIASYSWDFGDGSSGNGATPAHAYTSVGFFMVRLTVTDDAGATDVADTAVTISSTSNQPPVVDAGGPYSGLVGQEVQFDASNTIDPDGDNLIFLWDFGDGSQPPFPSQNPTASHAYSAAGTYTVRVAVTDGSPTPAVAEVLVTITEDDGPLPPPSLGDTWEVRLPIQQTEFTVSFQGIAGMLWVVTTQADGQMSVGIGLELDGMILWMDISGAVFFGTVDHVAGTMTGIVFNGSAGSSVWFGERL